MVEELLTSRPPLLLSCCLEGNPDNMKKGIFLVAVDFFGRS